jgi:two-component system response regulator RegX3
VTRVLVVDDEAAIREAVVYSLRAEGLDVEGRSDGQSAIAALEEETFDLVLLDVMLGDISGVEICRRVRERSDVPILMLTARDEEADVVLGLEAGADDYVTKPFSMRELTSRTRAIIRRRDLDRAGAVMSRSVGDVELDLVRHEVRVAGRSVTVTPTEFRLLELLATEDRPFSRRELLEHAWQTTFVPDPRSCDAHVANLRRKIEAEPQAPRRLVTVRGVGYRLARS